MKTYNNTFLPSKNIERNTAFNALSLLAPWVLATALISSDLAKADEAKFYRYHDDRGHVVINDRVPPEFVSRGYEVVNSWGQVIERIDPAATPEDIYQQKLALEQEQYDRTLMRRYSSEADIVSARDRYLRELNIRIDALENGLASAKQQLLDTQQELLNGPEEGHSVELLKKNEVLLREEVIETAQLLKERHAEVQESQLRFEKELNRLRQLKAARVANQ